MSALDGVRVVDVSTGIAGPLAAMVLADFGAEVVKAELEPPPSASVDPGLVVWNRGKRPVSLTEAESLVAAADLLVASDPLDRLHGGAFDPAVVCDHHPGLVYLHTPPYTDTAPWAEGRESDPLLAAITGVAARQASGDGGPIDDIYPHLVTVQGMWAAAAAVAALYERETSGLGQIVTVAGVHGVMVAAAGALTFDPSVALDSARPRPGGAGGGVPFYRIYECEDGQWLFFAALTPRFTERGFKALGLSDLINDPRLEGGGRAAMLSPAHSSWAIEQIAGRFRTRPRHEWLDRLAAEGCPAGPLLPRHHWLDHPQLAAIGMRVEVDDPEVGPVIMPGVPLHLVATPGRARPRRLAVTSAPSWPPRETATAQAQVAGNGPLDGVRVLDLGAIIAGPFAASLLAELGADVIKVEPPSGDSFRGPGFAAYNKGQRGVVLDLQQPAERADFLGLVASADVVIDNYRPGVLRRLALTYDDLRQVKPDIITISVTGFGDGGPLGQEPGFDPVLQAMSGMMTAQGGADDPVFFTVPVNDVAAAATAAAGACLALFHRARAGAGQQVSTSLAAMSALLQAPQLARFEGRPAAPEGSRDHKGPGEHDRFHPVADGWIRVQSTEPLPFAVSGLTRGDAVKQLGAVGVPAAPCRSTAEVATDPDLLSYGVLHPDPRPNREGWLTAGRHAHFSRTERTGTLVAPDLGQHQAEVLGPPGAAGPLRSASPAR